MNKKRISIIGTCLSRNLFNTSLLNDVFDIDCYICQVCTWALFDKGLPVQKETIYKANVADFEARILWYELCKTAKDELVKYNSEYVMIDLHNIYADFYEISLGENTVYAQNNSGIIDSRFHALQAVEELKGIKSRKAKLTSLDRDVVVKGLKSLADFLKANYEEDKIILHIPRRASRYCDLQNNFIDYDENLVQKEIMHDSRVYEFSEVLKSFLPKAKVLYNLDNYTAKYILSNIQNGTPIPESNHFSDFDNINTAEKLISLLQIDYEKYRRRQISALEYEVLRYNSLYLTSQKDLLNSSKDFITLNDYFDKIEDLRDVIIVISAKDNAADKIKYFRNKAFLGITADIGLREAYVAIIDKSHDFIFEQNGTDKIKKEYSVEGHNVTVQSAGFVSGNISSVKVDDGIELSGNHRGLNIVLLNSKTLELVDTAYCDTHGDRFLKVYSQYFSNVKIKV